MTIPRNLSFLAEGASSTGVLSVTFGGTGLTSLSTGYIPYGNGTGAFSSSSNLFYNGNLGIGTNTPQGPLSVSNSGAAGFEFFPTAPGGGTGTYIQSYNRSGGAYVDTYYYAASHTWRTNTSATSLTLDSSGNLLVNATATVNSSKFYALNTAGCAGVFYNSAASQQAIAAVRIDKADNTNTTSQVFVQFTINSQATGSGQINANGAGAAAFGSYSDARLKENIIDLAPQLNNIMALRPVEFDYIESAGGGHQIGFIAQEMQEIYPDVVGEREDGMLTISGLSKTEARLIKALQELNIKFDAYVASHP